MMVSALSEDNGEIGSESCCTSATGHSQKSQPHSLPVGGCTVWEHVVLLFDSIVALGQQQHVVEHRPGCFKQQEDCLVDGIMFEDAFGLVQQQTSSIDGQEAIKVESIVSTRTRLEPVFETPNITVLYAVASSSQV
jgi:hypothetical protein